MNERRETKQDTDVFIYFYEQVWKELYRFALYYLGNKEDAEDAVQETAADAFRGFSGLKDKNCFRPWIFKILSRKCKRSLRMTIRLRNNVELSDTIAADGDMAAALEVNEAISSLENEERMIILLSVVENFKCSEIADILSKPEGTVRSKRSRALAKLREKLGGGYYE